MHTEFLMGNAAIARGAIASGLNLVAGYPGTPSTEVLETAAKINDGSFYVEWSVNEKAALELAAGASYSGARTMVTMKQVGLNVASDPLMSLAYIGVKGGMVILVADDPGPISSQTEQDTRTFAAYSKLPCFDPSSVQEAYDMIQEAFEWSEKYHTPVLFRPTTRIDHGYASIAVKDPEEYIKNTPEGFVKDSSKWVIFPRLSNAAHRKIAAREPELSREFSAYGRNGVVRLPRPGFPAIASHGISFAYTMDALQLLGLDLPVLKIATPYPFPEELALQFLKAHKEVLCIEELDPVIERALTYIAGKYHLDVTIRGKLTGDITPAGENTVESVADAIRGFAAKRFSESVDCLDTGASDTDAENPGPNGSRPERSASSSGSVSKAPEVPALPIRPPVLCAGCPHRASFYAVKQAMKGEKTVFCGDIGCYTLGNAMPLDMVDTCLCMGAGLNIAQGIGRIEPDTKCFAFVGDSTFFASAITGVVNAVYNQADMTVVILDNSTTAMTGHQPHPGTGRTMMGQIVDRIDIEAVLRGVGVKTVETVNPLALSEAVDTVKRVALEPGVKAIIFRSPCAVLVKPNPPAAIDPGKCIGCKRCIRELGCPGIVLSEGRVSIESALCTGCGLCRKVCPVQAIS